MTALKSALGPHYDLAALWDMHVLHEFETRDVDATMATMVAEPYVNHIPTMTGGYGHRQPHPFYTNYFVHCNPAHIPSSPLSMTPAHPPRVIWALLSCPHAAPKT